MSEANGRKLQARNIDEWLYQLVEESAKRNDRSMEGEVRRALRLYYQPATVSTLTDRERWQRDTGLRLRWLLERLIEDKYFVDINPSETLSTLNIVRIARLLKTSPGTLMDIMEGQNELTFSFADALAYDFNADADWLLTGKGSRFPVIYLDTGNFRDYFYPEVNNTNHSFELMRISCGRHEGTFMIVRKDIHTRRSYLGLVTESFLPPDQIMANMSYNNLKNFFMFLIKDAGKLSIQSFDWIPDELDFQLFSVIGQHHISYFENSKRRSPANWLESVLKDPRWFSNDWTQILKEIKSKSLRKI